MSVGSRCRVFAEGKSCNKTCAAEVLPLLQEHLNQPELVLHTRNVSDLPPQTHQEDRRCAIDMAWLQPRLGDRSDPQLLSLRWIIEILEVARDRQ